MSEKSSVFHVDGLYQPLIREIGLDADAVFTDARIKVWRSLPDRENATLDHIRGDGTRVRLHVKRYPPTASAMASREVAGYRLLQQAGVPAAPIIAHGSRGDGGSFVILQDLTGYTPADKLLERGLPFDRLLTATADLAALLHDRQLHHRDLYLCHFMIDAETVPVDAKLIDMARVARLSPLFIRRRWIVKDLAQFWYSTLSLPISEDQRLAWLERYCQRRSLAASSLLGSIQRKSAAIARHDRSLRQKQPGRNISIGE